MNTTANSFSGESKEMMAAAKEIAITLGYDRISTLHFFLANCAIDGPYSLRKFAFNDESDYQIFYEKCRREKPKKFTESPVPLTYESEKALRTAVQVWFRRYHDEEIKSYHILIAASKNRWSALSKILNKRSNLQRELEHFYIRQGLIHEHNIKRNFWEKFMRR